MKNPKSHKKPVWGATFRFCRRLPRLEKYLARRIFRAKKRRGVIIIPCIAVDSFDAHTHTHRERAVSIYISIYIRAERERRKKNFG